MIDYINEIILIKLTTINKFKMKLTKNLHVEYPRNKQQKDRLKNGKQMSLLKQVTLSLNVK